MSAAITDPILQLINLKKQFGHVVAVDDVSLDIGDGEFLTLLGPSGSGKTTILNMIAGFEFPTAGEVILQGEPINFLLPEKRNIGMVFQNYALFPHMTIYENIAFPLKMRKFPNIEIEKRVNNALELVQLGGYETRYPKQLSGGQQQRIALARALVFEPPLLLLDEPLGALDKKLREHMQIELKHIHTRLKRTMIYVTHDQEEALVMSNRIAVMNQAKIVQVGEPDELYDRPATEFVAGFIGESNIFKGPVTDRSADRLTLKIEDGSTHQFQWDEDVQIGKEIAFCLRPEKLFFVEDHYADCCFKGLIEEVIYVGETKRYTIKISEHRTVHLREMSVRIGKGRTAGEKVKVGWHRESLRKVS
jgi:putative spermidine/putrescine transport system ATP-binding protein